MRARHGLRQVLQVAAGPVAGGNRVGRREQQGIGAVAVVRGRQRHAGLDRRATGSGSRARPAWRAARRPAAPAPGRAARAAHRRCRCSTAALSSLRRGPARARSPRRVRSRERAPRSRRASRPAMRVDAPRRWHAAASTSSQHGQHEPAAAPRPAAAAHSRRLAWPRAFTGTIAQVVARCSWRASSRGLAPAPVARAGRRRPGIGAPARPCRRACASWCWSRERASACPAASASSAVSMTRPSISPS